MLEFDSSERLLVTRVCVWAHLFCSRHKLEKMPRDRKRKIEIDPGKMTDTEREKKGKYKTKGEEEIE